MVAAARERALPLTGVEDFTSVPGQGVTATVDGSTITVGAPARLLDTGADARPQRVVVAELEEAGRTAVVVLRDREPVGVLGIAMGRAGSDLALETADAVVVRDELATIPPIVRLSPTARRLVVQNLAIAGAFITVLVAWDLIGTLPLPLGVAGHEGSTVIVGLNGLRLLRESAWPRPARDSA